MLKWHFCLGSDSDSDTDLDLALLQRLEKIEGREAEQDRRRIQEEEEKVCVVCVQCHVFFISIVVHNRK